MELSIIVRADDVVVRLPPSEDPRISTYGVFVVKPGGEFAGFPYDYLRSLGNGGWDIPDDPARRLDPGARRLPYGVLDSIREEQEAGLPPEPAKSNG